ncbi:hypothetical protein Lal_00025623 [Lupinus albus]|nr:hypothetical protein Lal_00025623 [Lupinus albus]
MNGTPPHSLLSPPPTPTPTPYSTPTPPHTAVLPPPSLLKKPMKFSNRILSSESTRTLPINSIPLIPLRAISTPWAHGAGHVDPQKALSPGLVYDASADDYITFLCSLNYT